jgi:hypothetical protein
MRLALVLALAAIDAYAEAASEWPQFRGPDASGVSVDANLPVAFGPQKNVVWKTSLPGETRPRRWRAIGST